MNTPLIFPRGQYGRLSIGVPQLAWLSSLQPFGRNGRASNAASAQHMLIVKTLGLFVVTALAEIVGCYLPYLWLKKSASAWVLIPALVSLALFVWLLTLHPTAAGRVYAAYGGVYVAVAVLWLWLVDGNRPTTWDLIGAAVAVSGMAIIMLGPRQV